MNISILFGIILLFLGAAGVWSSRIRFPNAPFFFPKGTVLDYTRIGYFLGLSGGFLIFWGVFGKIRNFSIRIILKLILIVITFWIGYKFYQTNVWDWHRFLKF